MSISFPERLRLFEEDANKTMKFLLIVNLIFYWLLPHIKSRKLWERDCKNVNYFTLATHDRDC